MKASAKKAEILGREIALHDCILTTGATIGLPAYAARGAKSVGGLSIGFSPAVTPAEHLRSYRLPLEDLDVIVYTGFNYSGRNLMLTRASDAVIVVGGRIGTLNEFTVAFEDHKVIGVLTGSGGITDEIDHILTVAKRGRKHIIFESDPVKLVHLVVLEVAQERKRAKIKGGDARRLRERRSDQ